MPEHDDLEKKAAPLILLMYAGTGAVVGALIGFGIWFRLDWRLRAFSQSHALDSWLGFILIVGGIALLLGVVAGCLKERFWEDWRSPFRW